MPYRRTIRTKTKATEKSLANVRFAESVSQRTPGTSLGDAKETNETCNRLNNPLAVNQGNEFDDSRTSLLSPRESIDVYVRCQEFEFSTRRANVSFDERARARRGSVKKTNESFVLFYLT